VPLFVLMGVVLEKSRVAEELLDSMAALLGRLRGGLAISVVLVGMPCSPPAPGSSAPRWSPWACCPCPACCARATDGVATGTICATGTLGQIIPPSIALVLLGDILSSAYQQAQLSLDVFNPQTVSVGDLFVGAIVPGLLLVASYCLYLLVLALLRPQQVPPAQTSAPCPGASCCAACCRRWPDRRGARVYPRRRRHTDGSRGRRRHGCVVAGHAAPRDVPGALQEVLTSTLETTAMVFMILIGAAVFSLVFRGFGGEELIQGFFADLPGGVFSATLLVMVVIFLLGFVLDFIEITFVVVPIVGPILLMMGVDPVWLGIMIAINLQTSFLTPPFGFALFYLRGVAPDDLRTTAIYRGVIPFIAIQLLVMATIWVWPALATWLPSRLGP
jgi:TRAP-type mannitol/chloroaromatic compound transport system permease large subunit